MYRIAILIFFLTIICGSNAVEWDCKNAYAGFVAGVAAPKAVLYGVGFTSTGVAKGSIAAAWQSWVR